MTKINCNIPAIRQAFKDPKDIKTGEVNVNGKTYKVTRVQKISWRQPELTSRRLLGGALVALTLGLILLYKPARGLFNKTKSIHVTAVLAPTFPQSNTSTVTTPGSKTPKPVIETPSSEIFPNFGDIPDDIKKEIALRMAGPELLRLKQTSKTAKIIAEQALTEKPLELYAEIAKRKENLKDSKEYSSMEQTLLADPKLLMQFLLLLRRKPSTEYQSALEHFLHLFIEETQSLNNTFLSACTPEEADSLLQLVVEYELDAVSDPAVQKLYFDYASSETFVNFVKNILESDETPLHEELETWLARLNPCFDETNPRQLAHRNELFLHVILVKMDVDAYFDQRLEYKKILELFSFLAEKLPDLTLEQFSYAMKFCLNRFNILQDLSKRPCADYLSFKLIKLCQSALSDQELRKAFTAMFHDYHQHAFFLDPQKGDELFLRAIREMHARVPIEDIPPESTRKTVYIFNGLGKFVVKGDDLQAHKMADYLKETTAFLSCQAIQSFTFHTRKKQLNQEIFIALREWVHSYMDTVFAGDFSAVFKNVDRVDLLDVLVEESLKLEEPLKSFHLRALAHGLAGVTLPLREDQKAAVFAKYREPVPPLPVTDLDILTHCFIFKGFLRSVQEAKTPELLEAVIKANCNLPSDQRLIRLRTLAQGLESEEGGKVVACHLPEAERKKVFAKCGLNFEQLPKVSLEDFLSAERQAFGAAV